MRPLLFVFFFSTVLAVSVYAQEQSSILQYNFRAGLDLIYTATIDLSVEGDYSELSTRVIENRFVFTDGQAGETATVVGLSRMVQRVIESQVIEAPYGNFQAYRFSLNPVTGLFQALTLPADYGTGWTPMICFPPLPGVEYPANERADVNLPVFVGTETPKRALYSVLRIPDPDNYNLVRIAAGLREATVLQDDPPVTLEYQEHEVIFNRKLGLPDSSRTSSNLRMGDETQSIYIDITVESHRNQANIFQESHIPVIRQETEKFFEYKDRLNQVDSNQAEQVVNGLLDYAEKSQVPILREAAKDLVLRKRFEQRLEENRFLTSIGATALPFQSDTLGGGAVAFSPEDRVNTVLLFWALWWEAAEEALLDIESMRKQYESSNLRFIGVNLDTKAGSITHYLNQSNVGMATVWDQDYPRTGIAFQYGVQNIPTILVIDKSGKVVARDLDRTQLENLAKRMR